MKGEELLTVAAELVVGATEAHHRSAVSRAYYGDFHVARRLLVEVGVHVPKGEQVHAKVIYCLQDCGDEDAAEAADEFVTLRNERNRADYDVDRLIYKKIAAKDQVDRAQGIVVNLERCRSGPDAVGFRAKVRAQARLLGLPVSS
jgi:uncharacterized protein (UPF0332 family)